MTSTLILTILLVFSFVVGRFLRRFQTPNFVFSGMIYLIFGLLLGPKLGFGVLSKELLAKLDPLTSLLIGIVGCLLGLRLSSLIKQRRIFLTGLISAFTVFIAMVFTFVFLSPLLMPEDYSMIEFMPFHLFGRTFAPHMQVNQLWFCLGIGATACSASLLNLGTASRKKQATSEISKVLSHLTKAVQCLAIILIGVCLASARSTLSADQLNITVAEWLMASIFSGVLCGFLFSLFIGRQSNSDRILLAALGNIIFASGIGSILGISALFVTFTTGATISLFSSYRDRLMENLSRLEEPIFVLLLIISGASWEPEISSIWLLPLIYFLIRLVIFSAIPQFIYRQISRRKLSRLGQGLLGQDLMAVAVALSFAKQFPETAQMFLTTILGSIFLNDILASSLLKKVILDNEQKISLEVIETASAEMDGAK